MSRIRTALKPILFLLIFALLFVAIQRRFTPQWDYPTHYSRTGRAVAGIYREPKQTLEVLWLGTSHMQNALAPMILYQDQGIRSYNLATTGQPLMASYYRLKSVLKDQSPKAVVWDVGYFFSGASYQNSEIAWQKIIASMPFSRALERLEMMKTVVDLNPNKLTIEDVYGGVLSLLRFHTNYNFNGTTFIDTHREQVYVMKGQASAVTNSPPAVDVWKDPPVYEPDPERTQALIDSLEAQRETVEKIVALCRENGCEVVLTKVPVCRTRDNYSGYWDQEKHDLIQAMADSMGIPFVDVNYEDAGIDWSTDSCDGGIHLNMRGAIKYSRFMGKWLEERYQFEPTDDPELKAIWDRQSELFDSELAYSNLQMEYHLKNYLELLKAGNYTVFAAVSNTIGDHWTQKHQDALFSVLGSETDLHALHADGNKHMAYAVVASNGTLIDEAYDARSCALKGTLEDGTPYELTSKYAADSSVGTIVVDGEEVQTKGRGIHFVVYDNDLHCVVDSISFDTQVKGCKARHSWAFESLFRRTILDYEFNTLKDLYQGNSLLR